jgi:hypothetical protein
MVRVCLEAARKLTGLSVAMTTCRVPSASVFSHAYLRS